MKYVKILLICILGVLLFSCRTTTTIPPVQTITIVERVDSTIIRDSIVYIPQETIKEVVPKLDTLHMSTSLAEAHAYLDTTLNMLRGEMKNKKNAEFIYKTKEKIVYKDSISYKEVPVPYPVDKIVYKHTFFDKLTWLISLVFVFYIIYRRIRNKFML